MLSPASKSSAPSQLSNDFVNFGPAPSFKLCFPSGTSLAPPAVPKEVLNHIYPNKEKGPSLTNPKKRKRKKSLPAEEQSIHCSTTVANIEGGKTWLSNPFKKKRQRKENGSTMDSSVEETVVARKAERDGMDEEHRITNSSLISSIQKRKKKERLQQNEADVRPLLSPVNR